MFRSKLLVLIIFLSFCLSGQDTIPADKKKKNEEPEEQLPPAMGDVFKPAIGFGTGMFSFFGDVYSKNYQAPWTSRVAYDLSISQPLNNSFRLNFYVLFGKLGANERINDKRFVNFESQVRMGGLNVMYNFDHLFNENLKIRPWLSLGFEGFEFLSKTDLYDRFGNKYYYWSDGSIKNMDESAGGAAQNAVELVRDYTYESDIREMNLDGFGKYPERSWAIPMGAGAIMKVGERFEIKMGATFHYTFTDYIDGISNTSVGTRAGNKRRDCFVMTSFSLHYDLITKHKTDTLPDDYFSDVDFVALDNGDEDDDKVRDFEDKCHGTPAGVVVDKNGCPLDNDGDWIPDYRDDEEATPKGVLANGRGVGYSEDMASKWYELYYDSTGSLGQVVRIGNVFAGEENVVVDKAKAAAEGSSNKEFTVEVARFKGAVPDDIMLYLLSVGDVKSTNEGDMTIYTAGSYTDINTAIKRKEEFESSGIKDVKIGVYKPNGDYELLSEKDVISETNLSNGVATNRPNDTSTVKNPVTNPTTNAKGVFFRVQLGAYKHKINKGVFGKNAGNVVEIPTDDGWYHYVSGSYGSLQEAAVHRADIVLDGYPDAFITAYKNGKRVPLKEAGATYENKSDEKENLNEKETKINAADKTLLSFKVQIGLKKVEDPEFEKQAAGLKDFQKQGTATGYTRYTAGRFATYNEAVKFKNQLVAEGFSDAFVIAMFKDDVISIQEALEFQK
jgi:hypothetical protein